MSRETKLGQWHKRVLDRQRVFEEILNTLLAAERVSSVDQPAVRSYFARLVTTATRCSRLWLARFARMRKYQGFNTFATELFSKPAQQINVERYLKQIIDDQQLKLSAHDKIFLCYAAVILTGQVDLVRHFGDAMAALNNSGTVSSRLPGLLHHDLLSYAAASGSEEVFEFIAQQLAEAQPLKECERRSQKFLLLGDFVISGNEELLNKKLKELDSSSANAPSITIDPYLDFIRFTNATNRGVLSLMIVALHRKALLTDEFVEPMLFYKLVVLYERLHNQDEDKASESSRTQLVRTAIQNCLEVKSLEDWLCRTSYHDQTTELIDLLRREPHITILFLKKEMAWLAKTAAEIRCFSPFEAICIDFLKSEFESIINSDQLDVSRCEKYIKDAEAVLEAITNKTRFDYHLLVFQRAIVGEWSKPLATSDEYIIALKNIVGCTSKVFRSIPRTPGLFGANLASSQFVNNIMTKLRLRNVTSTYKVNEIFDLAKKYKFSNNPYVTMVDVMLDYFITGKSSLFVQKDDVPSYMTLSQ